MLSHRSILARPIMAVSAAVVFVASVLLLPIRRHSPSLVGTLIAGRLDSLLESVLGLPSTMYCVFPHAQKWYTFDTRDQFVTASDQLVNSMPTGVPLVLVSADTFPSGKHGFWAATSSTWQMRITVDSVGLTATQASQLRAQFVDELAAAGDPAIQRDQVTLRTTDIHRRKILWSGYLHNTASLASFLLFATSTSRIARRTWRRLRTAPGHCPHCAYDLRATPPDAPCPECGRAAPR